jgi:sodium-dependent dicarboxylate transporter 2/3/5
MAAVKDAAPVGTLPPSHYHFKVTRRRIGFVLGPVLAVVVLNVMPSITPTGDVGFAEDRAAAAVAATLILMAVWWMTEVLPLFVTAFLPLVAFPLLHVTTIDLAAAPYANKTIFLFLGGFVLALSMERWNLHRRIAIRVILAVGSKPRGILFGFMFATSFLSLWVSNTATAVMMLPIATSVLKLVERVRHERDHNFRVALILSIAYGASIGSFGTPIASPPNLFVLGYLAEQGIEISFLQWMLAGMPLWIVALIVGWLILSFISFPPAIKTAIEGQKEVLNAEHRQLGPFQGPERRVAVIFLLTALTWIFHSFVEDWFGLESTGITDELIAVGAIFVLFLCPISWKHPGRGLVRWSDLRDLPWGILYLFGGGLSIAAQVEASGLASWIGARASAVGTLPVFILILVCCLLTWIITEFMSNTAAAATLIPIFGSVAIALGRSPIFLVIPVALAASCAFMMPAGTPPNAVAYSSGLVRIQDMNKGGVLIAIACVVLVSAAMFAWGIKVFGG